MRATSRAVNNFSQDSSESKMSRFSVSVRCTLGEVDITETPMPRCRTQTSCPATGLHRLNRVKRNACQMIEASGLREGMELLDYGTQVGQGDRRCIISEMTAWDTRKLVFRSWATA